MTVFHPVQESRRSTIVESVTKLAYEVYCHIYGPQAAMMDVTKECRGGFSHRELIAFLYARQFPKDQWASRVDEALEQAKR